MIADGATEVAEYAAQAREFLDKGWAYLAAGNLHQASEKGWGAAAHMAKAVAVAHGWRYGNHADFNDVMYQARELTGNIRLRDLRNNAGDLHINYYKRKRHLNPTDIKEGLESVAKLLDVLAPLTGLEPADNG